MKIAVFSDTRLPTRADGGHGLGMSAHSIATGLAKRGHDVILYCGWGSVFDKVRMFRFESEMVNWYLNNQHEADVILDTSHNHILSKWQPGIPVLNRIADMECDYQPPNAVVNSAFMLQHYPKAELVNTGIVDRGYFSESHDGYLLFAGQQSGELGESVARKLAEDLDMSLRILRGVSGKKKWELLSNAAVLFYHSVSSAAPRLPVECGYCGVPTVCLPNDGTASIINPMTGVIAQDVQSIPQAIETAVSLDRRKIYNWYKKKHDYQQMIDDYESLLERIWKQHYVMS